MTEKEKTDVLADLQVFLDKATAKLNDNTQNADGTAKVSNEEKNRLRKYIEKLKEGLDE